MSDQTKRAEIAGAALETYVLVKLSSGKVVPTTAITDDAYGVNQEISAAADGDQVTCKYDGITKLRVGAAVAKGAKLMPKAAGGGRAVTAAGATAKLIGEALEAATTDGQVIYVRLYANRGTVLGA